MVLCIKRALTVSEEGGATFPRSKGSLPSDFFFFLRQERRDFLNVAHALALVKDLHFSSLSLIKLIQFATERQEQGHASTLSRVYSEP